MIVDTLTGSNTTMELGNGNKVVIGDDCELTNTKVKFNGKNNILKMDGRCHVANSVMVMMKRMNVL